MKHLAIFLVLLYSSLSVFSQVTIGAVTPPESFSILQLDGTNGGLRIPQLTTTERSTLSTSGNLKASGLVIYNTDKNLLEFWNGTEWISLEYNGNNVIGKNGLTSSLNSTTEKLEIELGGTLSSTRTIDMDGNNLEFETKAGQLKVTGSTTDPLPALDVEGKIRISKPAPLSKAGTSLVIDDDGNLGIETPETVASLMLFAQSSDEQSYPSITSSDSYNGNIAGAKVVDWKNTDIVSNTITTLQNSSEFTFLQDGQYEVNGYINYQPNSASSSDSYNFAGVNVIIQYSKDGGSTWNEISLSRKIWAAAFERAQTVILPSAIGAFNAGDRIRMIFFNPFSSNALPHGAVNGWGIRKPTGAKYTKGIKIIAL